METDIPKIYFNKRQPLGIEVMSFSELLERLTHSEDHDPFSRHRLEFFLILILTKHTYSHVVDFSPYTLTEGSALFVAQNQVHHFTKDIYAADGFCIVFDSPFLHQEYFLSKNHKLNRIFNYHIEPPVLHQKEMGEDSFVGIATKLYEEYTFPSNFAKSEILFTLLHVLLLQAERAKESQSLSRVKADWLELFNQFKRLLEKEYIRTRNARDYAAELFISYKFLNDIVKKLTQKTAKAFIDDYVTIEIKRYLVSTALSVKEISYKTGFEEPANLTKFFKKHTGMTPLKFRHQF